MRIENSVPAPHLNKETKDLAETKDATEGKAEVKSHAQGEDVYTTSQQVVSLTIKLKGHPEVREAVVEQAHRKLESKELFSKEAVERTATIMLGGR